MRIPTIDHLNKPEVIAFVDRISKNPIRKNNHVRRTHLPKGIEMMIGSNITFDKTVQRNYGPSSVLDIEA